MASNVYEAVLSHWHTLFEDFSTSTQEFYRAVEEAVRQRSLTEVEISRVLFKEGGIGTAQREYLRVQRKRVAFDICSAPYGDGHFFSWRLVKIPASWGGRVFARVFCPVTYYALDTALLFRDSVRSAIDEVISDFTDQRGSRALAPSAPRLESFDQLPTFPKRPVHPAH